MLLVFTNTNTPTTMTLFSAIMTETNGAIVADTLGLTFDRWEKSGVSESTYCIMRHADGFGCKVRFSLHADFHYDEWESLGTLDITKFASFDPEEFGEEDIFSAAESTREDYWIERPDYFRYELNAAVVGKMKARLQEITNKWNNN